MEERRRLFLEQSAAPPDRSLCSTYRSFVSTAISERGGIYAVARGDTDGLDAYLFSRTLGLPNVPSLEEFWRYARGAEEALARLAEAHLLDASPRQDAKCALLAHLTEALAAFDARTKLGEAARRGDVAQLSRLLEQPGCDVSEQLPGWPPDGYTCLHLAAAAGHTAAVAKLLDRGAAIDAPCCDGRRALHLAAGARSEPRAAETVALLLRRGADPRATARNDRTALHAAAVAGRLGAAKGLVAHLHSADLQARDEQGGTAVAAANCASQEVCCKAPDADWGAVIALIEKVSSIASEGGREEEARAFSRRSWRLHVASALQDAVEAGARTEPEAEPDLPELGRLLECYGGDIDAEDHDGTTVLHAAALGGRTAACKLLISHRSNVHATSRLQETPLHFAAREGHLAATESLLASGADVHARTKAGATPADLCRQRRERAWEAVLARLEA